MLPQNAALSVWGRRGALLRGSEFYFSAHYPVHREVLHCDGEPHSLFIRNESGSGGGGSGGGFGFSGGRCLVRRSRSASAAAIAAAALTRNARAFLPVQCAMCREDNTVKFVMERRVMYMGREFCGTIKPSPTFDDEMAADELESAMRGFGCDKQRVMRVLTAISNPQRQMIRTPYRLKYEKELYDELKKELTGDFEELILGLMETPTKYDVVQLNRAVKGLGTQETVLIEILCTRNNDELSALKNEYRTQFGRTLEEDIIADTSGDFQDILLALLQANRSDDITVNFVLAKQNASVLVEDEMVKGKNSKATMKALFATQNWRQLKAVFDEYAKLSGDQIENRIEKTFSGDARKTYLTIADVARSIPNYFATLLYESMKGLGTRDTDLIRLIVSRSEIDLALVREAFFSAYKKSLVDWIKSECAGAYRDGLVSLVNGN